MKSADDPVSAMKRIIIGRAIPAVLVFLAVAGAACRLYNMERRLSPEYADFLSKVRYIITGGERKTFLQLPDAKKSAFIEEFWRKRDPFPDAEGNEYRKEYEARVQRAEELFRGEGRSGWLTDRGRIFILFGSPHERLTYPMDASGYCREVWYYGNFPILFVDEHCTGQYILTAINLEHLQEINIAQGHFQQQAAVDRTAAPVFDVETLKVRDDESVYEAKVVLSIPYERIWFAFKENRLEAAFEVRMEIRTQADESAWLSEKTFELDVDRRDLEGMRGKTYRMEVPLVLEGNLAALRGEKLALHISVRNSMQGEEFRKIVEFRLEP